MNFLRRLASLPGVRRIFLAPAVRRRLAALLALRFALAARQVTTPFLLLRREYVGGRGTSARYTLRATGDEITLQHGRDLEALFEIFERGEYEPPPELRERLDGSTVRHVLDIGANIGLFSSWALARWPSARITAFEPAVENAPAYEAWARHHDRAVLRAAAAAAHEGTLSFTSGRGSGSHPSPEGERGSHEVAAVDVLPLLQDCDLAKIDIEGGEWAILADPRLAQVRRLTLVLEYHRNLAPSLPASHAARQLLERAGFTVGHERPNHWGHGIVWAWKG